MKSKMRILLICCALFTIGHSTSDERGCENHGYYANTDAVACTCPVGYFGQYCEAFTETYRPEKLFNNQKSKLVVIASTNYDPYGALETFRDGILNDRALQKNYYAEYYFSGYNSSNPQALSTAILSQTDFVKQFNAIIGAPAQVCLEDKALFGEILHFIKSTSLSETVINIFTQLPSSDDSLIELQKTALAFNIQINVFFSYSNAFCSDISKTNVEPLRSVADRTGGIFVPYAEKNRYFVSELASLSSNLQLINYDAVDGPQDFTVQLTTGFAIYYVFVSGALNVNTTLSTSNNAVIMGTYPMEDKKTMLYKIFPLQNTIVDLNVSCDTACSVQVVANGNLNGQNSIGVKIFTSFTDSQDVDTTYNYLKSGIPAYARVHVESVKTASVNVNGIAVLNEDSEDKEFQDVIQHQHSTFEYITNNSVHCVAGSDDKLFTKQYLRLDLSIGDLRQFAYVPFLCLSSPSVKDFEERNDAAITTIEITTESETSITETTSETETSTFTTTTEIETTTTPVLTTTTAPAPIKSFLPSIIIGFSYKYSVQQRVTLLRGPALLSQDFAESHYNNFVVTLFDVKDYNQNLNWTDNYNTFLQQVQDISWTNNDYVPLTDTNVVDTLLVILNDAKTTPRSIVTLLVVPETGSLDSDKQVQILQLATSKQIRIVLIVDLSKLQKSFIEEVLDSDAHTFYNQLTSVSDGHLLYTQVDIPNSDDGTVSLEDVFADLHQNAFPNKLVLTHISDYISKTKTDLGQIDLRGLNGVRQFNLTATYTSLPVSSGFGAYVFFTNVDTGNVTTVFSQSPTRNFQANLFSAQLNVLIETGSVYNVSVIPTIPASVNNKTLVYRLWQEVTYEDFGSISVQYKDLSFNNVIGPQDEFSAIAQITVNDVNAPIKDITVDFYDQKGDYVNTFDNFHLAVPSSSETNVFGVSPFECSSTDETLVSVDLSGYYTAKYTVSLENDSKFVQNVRFWCKKITPLECSRGTEIDGICVCLTHDSPHNRGLRCNIPDCSKNGHVEYDDKNKQFKCYCTEGYTGDFCEVGTCNNGPNYPATLANDYATATFGFIYETRIQLNAFLDELLTLLRSTATDKVRHFNFYLSCDGVNFDTIYFGTSKSALVDAIVAVKNRVIVVPDGCSTVNGIDITQAVRYGLQPLSRDVRGLIWIAASNGEPYVNDLEYTYYPLIQGYRQELYLTVENDITNTTAFDEVINAVQVTGGELLLIQIKNTGNISSYLSLILPQPTSLNAYVYNDTVSAVKVEAASLLTITSDKKIEGSLSDCPSLYTFEKTKVYKCSINAIISVSQQEGVAVSVRVLGGYSPVWTFVNETKEDVLEALPVVDSYPTLALNFNNSGLTITDQTTNGMTRFTTRDTCNFKYTSTHQIAVSTIGYHNFKFQITDSKSTEYIKIIPYVVTQNLGDRCINGSGKDNDAKCTCSTDNGEKWSGPDCSRPICQNGGTLNVFQNACSCPLNFGGRTCSQQEK